MNLRGSIKSDSKPSILMKPGETSLDDPSMDTQTASMFGSTLGEYRLDVSGTEFNTMRFGIVSSVRLDNFRALLWSTYFPTYRRNPIDQGKELCDIVSVGTSQNRDQRDALSIGNHVVLAAGLTPIRRIRTGFFPLLRRLESKRNRQLHGTSQ